MGQQRPLGVFPGAVNITGFATPGTPAYMNGDFSTSDVVIGVSSVSSGKPAQTITSLTVANNLMNSNFNVPAGIGSLISSNGQILDVALYLLNPLSNQSGALGTLSAFNVQQLTLDANTVGTIQTNRSVARGLNGDIDHSILRVGFTGTGSSSSAVGIGTLSVGGNLSNSTLQVLDGIGTFTVAGQIINTTIAAAYDPARPGATINALSVGAWLNSNLTAYSVSGSFNVMGNKSLGIAGTMNGATIKLLGASSGTTLNTFAAKGKVSNSNFQITGNVGSFKTAFFTGSNLFVGFAAANPADIFNTQTSTNWEGNFTLGLFSTTVVYNPANVSNTAGFADSDVVASILQTVSLSGLNSSVGTVHTGSFGVGFRTKGGSAGTLTINGASKTAPSTTIGAFQYFGLGG